MTVADEATGLRSDVIVGCAPADGVGVVLRVVAEVLPVLGLPAVDGATLDPAAPVARSPLCAGALLRYGAEARPVPRAPGPVLRVISGPSAGAEVALGPGAVVDVGRSSACRLVLDDPAVSRRHATVRHDAAGIELRDLGSLAGVVVDGRVVTAPHRLREGELVQLGGTRLLLEQPGRGRLALARDADGGYVVPCADRPPPGPWVAHTVQVARGRRWRAAPGPADLRTARIDAEAAADDEDTYLRARLPGPADVRRIAQAPRAELWSRRGWLEVRLGVADRPASVRVDGPVPAGWEYPVLRRAPVAVDLAALGGLGIAGPWPWVVQRLAWVLAQSAVLHAPDELPIVVLAPDADEDDLGWVRWLPHVRAVAWDPGDVAAAVRAIPAGPALVVLAGVADPALAGALRGRRLVCTADDPALLPAACRAVLTPTGDDAGAALRVDGGPPVPLEPDTPPAGAADAIARRLAPLRTAPAGPAAAHPLCVAPVSWADPGPR